MPALIFLRYWREGIMASLLIACGILWLLVKAEARSGAKWQTRAISAEQSIKRQNEAIEDLRKEADQRSKAVQEALGAARRANLDAGATIAALRKSAAEKRTGACVISDTLKGAGPL